MAPLRWMTDLTTGVRVWSLGIGMGGCLAPNPTRPVGQLPFIVSYVLILLKTYSILDLKLTHTHTHTHTH